MLFDTLKSLVKTFWDICLLRKGPENLPKDVTVLAIVGLLSILFSGVFSVIFTLLFLWLVLKNQKLDDRFIQTASALLGASVVLNVIALPLTLILLTYLHPSVQTNFSYLIIIFLFLVSLVFLGWTFAIAAHIFSRALNTSFSKGLFIAFGYAVLFIVFKLLLVELAGKGMLLTGYSLPSSGFAR